MDLEFMKTAQFWVGSFFPPIICYLFGKCVIYIKSTTGKDDENNENTDLVPSVKPEISERDAVLERFLGQFYSHAMSSESTALVILGFPVIGVFFLFSVLGFLAWVVAAISGTANVEDLLSGASEIGISFATTAIGLAAFYYVFLGRFVRGATANYFWHTANREFPEPGHRKEIAEYCLGMIEHNHRYSKLLNCRNSRSAISSFAKGRHYGKPSGMTSREFMEHPSNRRS